MSNLQNCGFESGGGVGLGPGGPRGTGQHDGNGPGARQLREGHQEDGGHHGEQTCCQQFHPAEGLGPLGIGTGHLSIHLPSLSRPSYGEEGDGGPMVHLRRRHVP